jgi:hypothetical protein
VAPPSYSVFRSASSALFADDDAPISA